MKNFFITHKLLSIIIVIALLATGSVVAFSTLNNDNSDVTTPITSDTSDSLTSETSTVATTQATEQPVKKITTETSDNVLMVAFGPKALQNWAHTSTKIVFDRSYPDSLIFTETPYHVAADGKYAIDISEKGDKSVAGYLTEEGSEIVAHIAGKDGVVMANPRSSYLFGWIADETNLREINFNGNFNTSNMVSAAFMFNNSSKLVNLDISCFDTSNVTSMASMFAGCSSLTNLDLSNFNTSNVTDMSWMFTYCNNLKSINISKFNTSNVTTMAGMFNACLNLTSLDLSNFNTSKVTDIHSMFMSNYNLTNINLSSFDTSANKNFDYMFNDCTSLGNIDISNFSFSNDCTAYDMFRGDENISIKYKTETYNGDTFDDYLKSIGAAD